jgi:hypothetical protein
MFERNPDKQYEERPEPIVKVFGTGGPSRMWSPVSTPGAKSPNSEVGFGDHGGFAGRYVCQRCGDKSDGVYRVSDGSFCTWVCSPCATLSRWVKGSPAVPAVPIVP